MVSLVSESFHFLELLSIALLLDVLGSLHLDRFFVVVSVPVLVQVDSVRALALLLHVEINLQLTTLHVFSVHLNHSLLGCLMSSELNVGEAF